MHLLTFLQITKPGILFRMMVLLTQVLLYYLPVVPRDLHSELLFVAQPLLRLSDASTAGFSMSTARTSQGIFFNGFFVAYVISPRVCHAFIG